MNAVGPAEAGAYAPDQRLMVLLMGLPFPVPTAREASGPGC